MEEKTSRLLLLEPDAAHAQALRKAFESHREPFQLIFAPTLSEGRRVAAQNPPDLIIAELFLPDGRGTELLLPEREKMVYPVIIATSRGDEKTAVETMKVGAIDYVVKSAASLAAMPKIAERALRIWQHILQCRQAEEALRESERRYRALVDNALVGVFRSTPTGNLVYANEAMAKILGYPSAEEIKQKGVNSLYRNAKDRERLLQVLRESGNVKNFELEALTRSGAIRNVIISASLEGDWLTGMIIDITERKRLETQLLQAQKMEAIGTLAGGIAHDFNNILAAIIGYTELISFDIPEGSIAEHNLQELLKAGHRAKDLVKQILAFSRRSDLEKKSVLIQPILKETLKLLRASLPATIEIRQEIDEEAGMIQANPSQIHQVIMNLCTNAAHAMAEERGILGVSLRQLEWEGRSSGKGADLPPGSYLCLTVSDSGQGMSPEVLGRIFDPYFTTKEVGKGTGLGLAVVHGIVKNHGGTITVRSTLGKGTTFEIFLPRTETSEGSGDHLKPEPLPLGGQERILLIDDEEALVKVGKQMLEHLGYAVEACTNSLEALELFRTHPERFDLVITDMTMPNLTGEKLAREFMKMRRGIPIILCTGFSQRITEEKAKEMGIREFVLKPLELTDLAKTIRRALDSQRKKKV